MSRHNNLPEYKDQVRDRQPTGTAKVNDSNDEQDKEDVNN
jgi:hypothetical protein